MGDNGVTVGVSSSFWFAGWLFTWGLLELSTQKIIYAVLVWPYYVGQYLRGFYI